MSGAWAVDAELGIGETPICSGLLTAHAVPVMEAGLSPVPFINVTVLKRTLRRSFISSQVNGRVEVIQPVWLVKMPR